MADKKTLVGLKPEAVGIIRQELEDAVALDREAVDMAAQQVEQKRQQVAADTHAVDLAAQQVELKRQQVIQEAARVEALVGRYTIAIDNKKNGDEVITNLGTMLFLPIRFKEASGKIVDGLGLTPKTVNTATFIAPPVRNPEDQTPYFFTGTATVIAYAED
ncbi:hypothetical protein [Tellurirhabdus bombi]|uniref:hypothetical protein n=1 Tax=Tellurirhabdus bombi TaxID=2907205 RepID=UPI001F438F85|nr:hypothetical protein [Tellurirhabdus bombi]